VAHGFKALTSIMFVSGDPQASKAGRAVWAKLSLDQRRRRLAEQTRRISPYFALLGIIGGHHRMGTPPPDLYRQLTDGSFVKIEGTWPEQWRQIRAIVNGTQSKEL
jgi:hypothetical protein